MNDKPETIADVLAEMRFQSDRSPEWADRIERALSQQSAKSGGSAPNDAHPDDIAVDRFAAEMKAKLAVARAKGRGGWDGPECNAHVLSRMLREHIEKGDPRDVANFCMFLHQRGESILPPTVIDKLLATAPYRQDAEYGRAYSIDADPAGIRARVAHAIIGAMAYGAQDTNPPPSDDHWLAAFWHMARAERERTATPPASSPHHGIDECALDIARKFTPENDPQGRAKMQRAVIDAVNKSRVGLDFDDENHATAMVEVAELLDVDLPCTQREIVKKIKALMAMSATPSASTPQPEPKPAAVEYDRALIADILEHASGHMIFSQFAMAVIAEQARLLREADNADASGGRTVRREPAAVEVTDAMVDRAAIAISGAPFPTNRSRLKARAALTAALQEGKSHDQ